MSDLDDGETIDVMWGDPAMVAENYRPALSDSLGRIQDATGISQEERENMLVMASNAFNDARLPETSAVMVLGHVASTIANPPSPETLQSWEAESRRMMRERYGAEEGTRRLDAVRAFVAARPELSALVASGAGSHPKVVSAFAEQARSLRIQPRQAR